MPSIVRPPGRVMLVEDSKSSENVSGDEDGDGINANLSASNDDKIAFLDGCGDDENDLMVNQVIIN